MKNIRPSLLLTILMFSLLRRGPNFKALTGVNIEVTTVPFAELYNGILTDQTTGTNSYDAFVMSPQRKRAQVVFV